MKNNFIIVNFFRVTDPYSGGSEVSFNFFENIPSKNKQLFQFSDVKKKHKNVQSIYINNSKISKILNIYKLSNKIKKFCEGKKNITIIIEGASWVGYSFLLYKFLKKDLNYARFIYHSQNIEYFLRKDRNNFFIAAITKFFEKYIAKNFDIFTCGSEIEKKKLKKLYDFNAKILHHGVKLPKNISKLKPIKKKYKYIFFCGNINYYPNYDALETLVKIIMPKLIKHNSNLKLIVTGNKFIPFKKKFLINGGFVSKILFFKYLKGATLFVNPIKINFGVQTKTLHALTIGKTIISTNQGLKGIKINSKINNVYVANNNSNFSKQVLKKINAKKINIDARNYYSKIYSLDKVILDFFVKNKLI